MSFKQAMLMTVVIFFSVIWLLIWNSSKKDYPPPNEMFVLNGEIKSFSPRTGKTNGYITLTTMAGDIELWSRLGEETTKKYGNLEHRKAIAMVHPNFALHPNKATQLMHLELVNEAIVIDYKSRYDNHVDFVKHIESMFLIVETIIFIFSALFIYSFLKKNDKNKTTRNKYLIK